jgi:hypothetical protein
MTQQTLFFVEGLRCAGCVDTVKQAHLTLEGVSGVEITLLIDAPFRRRRGRPPYGSRSRAGGFDS